LTAGRCGYARIPETGAFSHAAPVYYVDTQAGAWRGRTMRILISGSTGLVGAACVHALSAAGHQVVRLVRAASASSSNEILWNPAHEQVDARRLEGFDAVVHLSGENIANGRWTPGKKALIRNSRINTTGFLARTLAKAERPPKVLVSASAVGYYGSRKDEVLSESSSAGKGFLAEVCQSWEGACSAASDRGIRVANLRFGLVLSLHGGALMRMLPIFRLGLGGVMGGGRQYMSWVSLDDAVGIIGHVVMQDTLSGPINAVAPNPVTNREFTKILGKALQRPTILPVPGFALRVAFGEMADALLLSSVRAIPGKLLEAHFPFAHVELEPTLRHMLGR